MSDRFRYKVAVKVNSELLMFYWELGQDIVEMQKSVKWGDGFLSNLSHDLMVEFPEMRGFSKRNLEHIRRWFLFWSKEDEIAKQAVSQIPWWYNVLILSKTKNTEEALFPNSVEHSCYLWFLKTFNLIVSNLG